MKLNQDFSRFNPIGAKLSLEMSLFYLLRFFFAPFHLTTTWKDQDFILSKNVVLQSNMEKLFQSIK